MVTHPGKLRLLSSGVPLLGEVAKKLGQVDQPRKVVLAWRKKENQF